MKIEKRNFNIFHIHVVERERKEKENTKGIRFEIKRKLIIGTRSRRRRFREQRVVRWQVKHVQ